MSKRTETFTKEAYFCDQEIGGEQLSRQMDQRRVCPQQAEGQCGLCGIDLCKVHDVTAGRLGSRAPGSNFPTSFMLCGPCAEGNPIVVLVAASQTESFQDRKYAIKRAAIEARDG